MRCSARIGTGGDRKGALAKGGREGGAKGATDGTSMSATPDLLLVTTEFTIRVYHRAYDTNAIMHDTTCGRNYWPPTPSHVKQLR